MIIVSPAEHNRLACTLSAAILTRKHGIVDETKHMYEFLQKVFGFRVEQAQALFEAQYFDDPDIFKRDVEQLQRLLDVCRNGGALGYDDLEYDYLVPGIHPKRNPKSSILGDFLLSNRRCEDVCYTLGVPADKKLSIFDDVDLPIKMVGWCLGSALVTADKHRKAKFQCSRLEPMETLWPDLE
jgi:hypothetical protein